MSSHNAVFGTAVTCMDGRAIAATHSWMKAKHGVTFVDTLTEPGIDGWLSGTRTNEELAHLQKKLQISIMNHGSHIVTVGGHADCAGHPVSETEHRAAIEKTCLIVKQLIASFTTESVTVIGLYSEEKWVSEPLPLEK